MNPFNRVSGSGSIFFESALHALVCNEVCGAVAPGGVVPVGERKTDMVEGCDLI
jgi:hypothetical protein